MAKRLRDIHRMQITAENADLSKLSLIWGTPGFTEGDGLGTLNSLHHAGDAIVVIVEMTDAGPKAHGSGVMVGPGLVLTATHVLDEFRDPSHRPICITLLPDGARVWLPSEAVSVEGPSEFDVLTLAGIAPASRAPRTKRSDLAVLSCGLYSDAMLHHPLMLAPVEMCLPHAGERLWAVGFRHGDIHETGTSLVPLVSSGVVRAGFPEGRGERMPSPCVEVDMEVRGGMSGGPVYNADDKLVAIVSSSFEGQGSPTYATLLWDALNLHVANLPACVWPEGNGTIWTGAQLGLVSLKGKFARD